MGATEIFLSATRYHKIIFWFLETHDFSRFNSQKQVSKNIAMILQ